jgi:hypothetical protein
MKKQDTFIPILVIALAGLIPGRAAELISNGGFESGFTGWTRADQLGSDGTFQLQAGTASPVNGDPVPAPPGGLTAAMSDAQGPGSHVLYQDFVLPSSASAATLKFDLFVGNRADRFVSPDTLDFAAIDNGNAVLNQQARVDLLQSGADPFSLGAGDLLLNAFQTNPGDPLVSGYNHVSFDITAFANAHPSETLRLRFAEVDNVSIFQLGVDNVSITAEPATAPVPDSGLGAVTLLALGTVCWAGRRRTA